MLAVVVLTTVSLVPQLCTPTTSNDDDDVLPGNGMAECFAAVAMPVSGGNKLHVVAAVGSLGSFRLGVRFTHDAAGGVSFDPVPSMSLDPARGLAANCTRIRDPATGAEGIRTEFGQLLIRQDGRFVLKDSRGTVVATATARPTLASDDSITMPVTGSTLPSTKTPPPSPKKSAIPPTFVQIGVLPNPMASKAGIHHASP